MLIKPHTDKVLIRRDPPVTQSVGGILIPEVFQAKTLWGVVIAVGDGLVLSNGERAPMCVKPGDRVLFGKYSETEVKLDEELVFVHEDEIMAVEC